MNLTRVICQKALAHKFSDFPEEVVTYAKLALLDNLGCAIRGLREPLSKILAEELMAGPATVNSFLSSGNQTLHPSVLAQVYGATAHAIDFDDTLPTGQATHVGSPVMGAIMSLLPQIEASGEDLIVAIVAAYEANADIAKMLSDQHYEKGFHPTATVGVFAATIAAARLLKLDLEQLQNAIGIASTQAAGLKSTFGTMSKPFNAGQASAKGVLSALLAQRGFTGPENALEVEKGYLQMFMGLTENDRPKIETELFQIMDNMFKLYAACHATHPMIEALLFLTSEHEIDPSDIELIETTAPPLALKTASIGIPKTGLESKFSFSQMAALTVLGFNPASDICFEDTILGNSQVNAMRERFSIQEVAMTGFTTDTSITTKSGKTYQKTIGIFDLMDDRVMVRSRLLEKFLANARAELTLEQCTAISTSVMDLEKATSAASAFQFYSKQLYHEYDG